MSSSSSYHYPDEGEVNQYGVPYFKPGSCFAFQAWLRVLNREFRIRGLVYHIKTLTNEDPVVPEKPEGGWSMYGEEIKEYQEWKKNDALAFNIIWMSLDPSVHPITPEDMTAKQLYDNLIDRYGKLIRPEIQLKLRDFLNTPKEPDQSMEAYCISKENIFYELNQIEGEEVLDPGLLRQMFAQGLPRQQAYVPLRARLLDLDQE